VQRWLQQPQQAKEGAHYHSRLAEPRRRHIAKCSAVLLQQEPQEHQQRTVRILLITAAAAAAVLLEGCCQQQLHEPVLALLHLAERCGDDADAGLEPLLTGSLIPAARPPHVRQQHLQDNGRTSHAVAVT
jgi:hypothetical protein